MRCVVTQPDRPAGRGHKLLATPVKHAATELGLEVQSPESLSEFARTLARSGIDVFVLASYGRILPQALLDVPRLGSLNVHPSLLPKYRGATPLQSALRDGASETGISILLMDAGMDTGDIVVQERTPILETETFGELHDRLALLGAQVLGRALDLAGSESFSHRPQDGVPSVTRPLKKEDLIIDWNWPARRIVNAVRAFSPRPGARATLAHRTVKVESARIGARAASLPTGSVLGASHGVATVACGDGTVDIVRVTPESRGSMSGEEFARWLSSERTP